MRRLLHRFVFLLCLLVFVSAGPCARGQSGWGFFQKGRAFHFPPRKKITAQDDAAETTEGGGKDDDTAGTKPPETTPTPTPFPTPTPTPTPLEIRPATSAPPDQRRSRDLPYGVMVPNRPGLVTSPYAPNQGYVDVSGFPSSTEVMDPSRARFSSPPDGAASFAGGGPTLATFCGEEMKTGLRILTVEDETAVARLLALVLCGPKCKVVAASDGAEALAKIAARRSLSTSSLRITRCRG